MSQLTERNEFSFGCGISRLKRIESAQPQGPGLGKEVRITATFTKVDFGFKRLRCEAYWEQEQACGFSQDQTPKLICLHLSSVTQLCSRTGEVPHHMAPTQKLLHQWSVTPIL